MNKFLLGVALLLGIFCLSKMECKNRMKRDFPEIKEVLDAHNNLRKLEKASNMKKMKWDPELAEMAHNLAKVCKWMHGEIDSPTFGRVGQNIKAFTYTNEAFNWTNVPPAWYKEKSYYNFEDQTCMSEHSCGHYTQLVWAESEFLGCASAYCEFLQVLNWTKVNLAVCNYGPAGNQLGVDPYLVGEPCSDCDGECEDGLCV